MSAVLASTGARPEIVFDLDQRSDEWHAARAGKWSSSKAAVIMGGLDTTQLPALIQDVAWGRVFGPPDDGYRSKPMEHGTAMEPESRDWYAFERNLVVETPGLVYHATNRNIVWSPDGMIQVGNWWAGIEGKAPLHKAWMDCRKQMLVPAKYRWQCKWAQWVGQLEWLDFVCYHARAGGIIVRAPELTREEIVAMENRVELLEGKVESWVQVIKRG